MNEDPTMIEVSRRLIRRHLFVTVSIKDANDLPVDFNRVRDPDPSCEGVVDALCYCGLSRTRQSG